MPLIRRTAATTNITQFIDVPLSTGMAGGKMKKIDVTVAKTSAATLTGTADERGSALRQHTQHFRHVDRHASVRSLLLKMPSFRRLFGNPSGSSAVWPLKSTSAMGTMYDICRKTTLAERMALRATDEPRKIKPKITTCKNG